MKYIIKNDKNEYLTKRNLSSDFSLTDNENLASVFEQQEHAEFVKRIVSKDYDKLKIKEV